MRRRDAVRPSQVVLAVLAAFSNPLDGAGTAAAAMSASACAAAMGTPTSAAVTQSAQTAGRFHEGELDVAQARPASQVSPVFSALRSPPHLSRQPVDELLLVDTAFEDFRLEDVDEELGDKQQQQLQPVHGRSGEPLPMTRDARHLVRECAAALRSGVALEPLTDGNAGLGGIYLVRDRNGAELAVFKPRDEEPGTPDATSGVDGLSAAVRRGCPPGDGAKREYLAYALDQQAPREHRAGVPATALVRLQCQAGAKVGSLQRFVPNKGGAEDFGASSFSLENVHRLALFDLRTLNLDRHGGNMLVDAATGDLVPIDHGCAMPMQLGEPWLDWRLWRQAASPVSGNTAAFIQSLDPLAAVPLVWELSLSDGVWRTLAVMTLVLQASVAAGRSFREIADRTMAPQPRQVHAVPKSPPQKAAAAAEDDPSDAPQRSLVRTRSNSPRGKGGGGGGGGGGATGMSYVEQVAAKLHGSGVETAAEEMAGEWPWPGNAEGEATWLDRCREAVDTAEGGGVAVVAVAA